LSLSELNHVGIFVMLNLGFYSLEGSFSDFIFKIPTIGANKTIQSMKKEEVTGYFDAFSRRSFITKSTLATFGIMLGSKLVNGEKIPKGIQPLLLQDFDPSDPMKAKHPDMIVLNDTPWNVETPIHLLDDRVTPADKMFIRNNGKIPDNIDAKSWTLTIDGESVTKPVTLSLAELKSKFKAHTYQLVIECGGNGRSEFSPPTKGNQWKQGAVSCAQWTGVRLRDVLEYVGIKSDAKYIGYYGTDAHLSGDLNKTVISRGIPIDTAMNDEVLLAWSMNGKDIPMAHGFPLRLVVGGWPASVSGKWLKRLAVRNIIHDGPKMESPSYRVPCNPVQPGSFVPDEDMCIIETMPVKSIITYPKSGGILKGRDKLNIRGHAWSGDRSITKVELSLDYGSTWVAADLEAPVNKNAWQHWNKTIEFPALGYYEVWARATDSSGVAQPMVAGNWNPKGYLNNASHRIAIKRV